MPSFKTRPNAVLAGATLCLAVYTTPVMAQSVKDVVMPATPLVLRATGSILVGGERVYNNSQQLSSPQGNPLPNDGGHVTINQMYVEFMIPTKSNDLPVIMLHGATLSGKTYETTPDGRMGWYEYFVRKGYPVYVPDQSARARSALDISTYNDVRAGSKPASALTPAYRGSDEQRWQGFRIGPAYGQAFPDSQFPTAAWQELGRQAVPDFNASLPQPNPTFRNLADLAKQLKGAILMGHSQSGAFPLNAALTDPTGLKGLILVEPPRCGGNLSDADIATLAKIPILVLFGDHLDAPTGMPGVSWTTAYEHCQTFAARIQKSGGIADILYPPAIGIHGNSHLLMMDRNNIQIADLVLDWIDRRITSFQAAKPKSGSK